VTGGKGVLGSPAAYACMLGGADRRTLFVVTNSGSGATIAHRCGGRIATMRVGVPGAGVP
jgi:sugar lactone lactonase YvrE